MSGAPQSLPDLTQGLGTLDDWIRDYLAPEPGRPGRRAHLWTINGLTYPFIRDYHFAAVPEPSTKRRQDMLAGVSMARPGDLLFFFDADPRAQPSLVSRRGLRGIYRIVSSPFLGRDPFVDPSSGYRIHGNCPNCGTTMGALPRWDNQNRSFESRPCPTQGCNTRLPFSPVVIAGRSRYPEMILPWRVEVEPLAVFEVPVSDERAYSDMEDPGLLWVGRHDNQSAGTGRPGKGSSIRQLAPEEAVKLTRLLRTEPGQVPPSRNPRVPYSGTKDPMLNDDGTDATHPLITTLTRRGRPPKVRNEYDLCQWMARMFDNPNSSLVQALGLGSDLGNLEYASVLYPWGYTAGEADFIMCFSDGARRYRIIVVEAKTANVSDAFPPRGAILQVSMYVPWVIQRLMSYCHKLPDCLEVVPVTVGHDLRGGRGYRVAAPDAYDDVYHLVGGRTLDVHVSGTRFLQYHAVNPYLVHGDTWRCERVDFSDQSGRISNRIQWIPFHGVATGDTETEWVRTTSWAHARSHVGLPP